MDPLFACTPDESQLVSALALWPELGGQRTRPLFVSAFGEIFVESETGAVWSADPIELTCEQVADSEGAMQDLFSNQAWAEERLMTDMVILARDRGLLRPRDKVFALAPHPSSTGQIRLENLVVMDLSVWHHICSQLRVG